MKLGIQQTSLGSATLQDAFQMARRAGASGLGLCYPSSSDVSHMGQQDYARRLRDLAAAHGLAVTGLHLGNLCQEPTLITTAGPREPAMAMVRLAIWVAAEVGAPVVVVPFVGRNRIEFAEELEQAALALRELCQEAEDMSVTLAVESGLHRDSLEYLLDSVGSDAIQAALDTGELRSHRHDPVAMIRDLGASRIAQVFLRDVLAVKGLAPEFNVRLGRGDVEFGRVAQALHSVAYDGWVNVKSPPGDSDGCIAAANVAFAAGLRQVQSPPGLSARASGKPSASPEPVGA